MSGDTRHWKQFATSRISSFKGYLAQRSPSPRVQIDQPTAGKIPPLDSPGPAGRAINSWDALRNLTGLQLRISLCSLAGRPEDFTNRFRIAKVCHRNRLKRIHFQLDCCRSTLQCRSLRFWFCVQNKRSRFYVPVSESLLASSQG